MSSAGYLQGHKSGSTGSRYRDDSLPSTSDFVKKLYGILEDPAVQSVISWGPKGDCFVVKDINEFSKTILPRLFNHSNFASFVRQLNKYDFHKVRTMDGNRFGEHAWTFCHPDFLSDRRDALENIKRKGPTQRITQAAQAAAAVTFVQQQQATAMTALPGGSSTVGALTRDIGRLRDDNEDLKGRSRILERNYKDVLVKMVGLQESMVQQDKLMHSIVAYLSDGNSCQQQSRQDRNSEYAPQSTSRLIPKQQQNGYLAQAPHCDQSRYAGTSGHGTSAGWPLTPPSSVYSPEPLASLPSGDPPMQSLAVSPFPGSSSNQSPARYSPGIFPRQISLGPTHDAELAEWRRLGGCGYDSGWGESSGV